MRVKHRLSRVVAAVGAVAVGALGLLGLGAVANAAPAYGNIDPDAKGSITIHKFLSQPNDTNKGDISTGETSPGDFVDPVAGIVFTAYPLGHGTGAGFVPLNLSVPANWDGLGALTPGATCAAPTGYDLGEPSELPATNVHGASTLGNLPVGAYVVCETSTAGATVNGESTQITRIAAPFIATIPSPYGAGWIYDVHAFPKNLGFSPAVKSIDHQLPNGLVMGATVKFPVRIEIPAVEGGAEWPTGAVTDVFDSRLAPVSNGIESVRIVNNLGNVTHTFATPGEYTPEQQTAPGNGVAVVFTPAGLEVFNHNAHAGETVEIVFVAKVVSLGTTSGEVTSGVITNQAGVWTDPDHAFNPETSNWSAAPVTTNTVTTRWGQARIFKHASDTSKTKLQGAEFQLYDASVPYPEDGDCVANTTGRPLTVGSSTTLVSDVDGVVNIPGLFVSDSVNEPKDQTARCYVLVETKSPAGYTLPTNAATAIKVTPGGETEFNVEIANTQQSVPSLPITGAAGKVLLIIGAVGAGAVVIGLLLVNRRRTQAALK